MIRPAVLADLPRIVDIYNTTIPSRQVTADTDPVTVDSRYAWFFSHLPKKRPIWVAQHPEQTGDIIGWLSFSDFYGRPAYASTAELSIYIDLAWRGQKLGSQFLQTALDAAPGLHIETLLGLVFAHNRASVSLLEKFGFGLWGQLPQVAVLDRQRRDLLILGKALAGS